MDEVGVIRVLFADDESLSREALRILIDDQPNLLVVGEAESGCQAVDLAHELDPDVALISADLPACDGVDAMRAIADQLPRCRVIVLARTQDQAALMNALEAGASGFVTRVGGLQELIGAIHAVQRGEAMVPPSMLGPLLAALIEQRREQAALMQRIGQLTRREREVLALVCRGADSRMIAAKLVISAETARTHVQNVLSKLGVHSRTEAAALVGTDGLLEQFSTPD